LIKGDVDQPVPTLKDEHSGNLIVSGCRELAHSLTQQGFVDELWFWVHPYLWATGPRIFDGVGPVPLELVSSTPFRSGVLWLRYRPVTG
jgi:dihydrofolate reductase